MNYAFVLRPLAGWVLLGMLMLNACGRSAPLQSSAVGPQSGQQAVRPTVTLGAAERTKIVFIDAMATQDTADHATILASGELATPTGPVPSHVTGFQTEAALGYSPTPEPLLPEGLEPDCGYDNPIYVYGNCSNINHDRLSYFMVAGGLSADPDQGMLNLGLHGPHLSLADLRPVDYHTPRKVGKIEVVSATWPYVYVRTTAEPRTSFTFNLESRQWVDINGTPLPTLPPVTPTSQ
jgi:hypothetical protein